jgi:hypothetical protein
VPPDAIDCKDHAIHDGKTCKGIRKNELTAQAMAGQRKQAEKANKDRQENLNDLPVDTVVYIEENSKQGVCKVYGIVIELKERKSRGKNDVTKLYYIQTSHGVIKEPFQRERLYPVGAHVTKSIIGAETWTTEKISLNDTFMREKGRDMFCRCNASDCSTSKKCTCKVNGWVCTSKCHGGNGKNSKCCLLIN